MEKITRRNGCINAIKMVRALLIHQDSTSQTFNSEVEKSITKSTLEEKQLSTQKEKSIRSTKNENTNPKKRKFKVPFANKKI